ncbi:hypothetical protein [Arthrobacter sp. NPDC056493]|uniref:hypothetical protein n=1 Tax=Arthrobacter sp. NPDC056493 TaxID=3345839 RepID=UPI00366AEB61
MSRTPKDIAESLFTAFEDSSAEFQHELYQYGGQFGNPPASKNYVDAALSALAAALGPEQKELLAVAGITPEAGAEEDPQQCELVVFSEGLLFHTAFSAAGNTAPAVQVLRRSSITSVTITSAAPFNLPAKPERLRFTAVYEGGLVLDFPLKGNRANVTSTLADVLTTLRSDLESKP